MGISIVSVLCVVYCDSHFGKQTPPYKYVSPSGICAVLTSVSSFMFFKDFKIKNYKIINVVAASTFGVLLIHDNCAIMRQWLWQELVNVKAIYSMAISSAMLQMVSVVLAVFIICILLDMLCKRTIERWILNQINKKL